MREGNGIFCPCGGVTCVIDSRPNGDSRPGHGHRRRRHRCEQCGERFTTYEITAVEYDKLRSAQVNIPAINRAIGALQLVKKSVQG